MSRAVRIAGAVQGLPMSVAHGWDPTKAPTRSQQHRATPTSPPDKAGNVTDSGISRQGVGSLAAGVIPHEGSPGTPA